MNRKIQPFDIVIVGAGLVGSTLAALLGRNTIKTPVSIAVIEAGAEPEPSSIDSSITSSTTSDRPQFDAKVVALSHSSQQLLTQVGAWPSIQSQRVCPYREMYVWDSEGTGNIHFQAKEMQCDYLGHIVESNIALCAILDSVKKCRQVSLMHEIGLDQIERREQDVLLQLTDGQVLSTPLVVAADGAHSKVRELMNFRVREWDYHQRAIVTTVQSECSHQFTAWQNFLPSGPLAFLPLDHPSERYCSIVWSLDNELAEQTMSLTDQAFADNLGNALEYCLGRIENVDKRFCFPLKQRHAVDYTTANIALIGDAAHTIHPLAGQGVNLGLLDAKVLATEIKRALKRGLPLSETSLLKRYQRQRKIHNLEAMAVMESLQRLFGSKDPAIRWLRNSGLRKINTLTPLKSWLAKQAMGL